MKQMVNLHKMPLFKSKTLKSLPVSKQRPKMDSFIKEFIWKKINCMLGPYSILTTRKFYIKIHIFILS